MNDGGEGEIEPGTPLELDPITGEKWVGIRMSDGRHGQIVSLIPLATVLNVTPPERGAV